MKLLRYSDLVDRGIVNNRATLYRWIREHEFPAGILIGPNSRVWPEEILMQWLESRATQQRNAKKTA